MSPHEIEMHLSVGVEPDADAAELDHATLQLRQELLSLDVDSVVRPEGEPPPPGTRAAALPILGALVVELGKDVIAAAVHTIQNWVSRHKNRSVKLTIDGDTIEVSGVSPEDQQRLIASFLARHAAP